MSAQSRPPGEHRDDSRPASARRQGREAALQVLYAMDLAGVSAEQAIAQYWGGLSDGVAEESAEGGHPPPRSARDFAESLVRGIAERAAEIDEQLRAVSQHWRLERMARVDRNILRLGVYEVLYLPDVPKRVTINEALELAKRFGTDSSAGFINGVLDRIATDLKKA